jgi:hypothetical protein
MKKFRGICYLLKSSTTLAYGGVAKILRRKHRKKISTGYGDSRCAGGIPVTEAQQLKYT